MADLQESLRAIKPIKITKRQKNISPCQARKKRILSPFLQFLANNFHILCYWILETGRRNQLAATHDFKEEEVIRRKENGIRDIPRDERGERKWVKVSIESRNDGLWMTNDLHTRVKHDWNRRWEWAQQKSEAQHFKDEEKYVWFLDMMLIFLVVHVCMLLRNFYAFSRD